MANPGLKIQGKSANHGDNRKPGKNNHAPPKLQIQASSANYAGKQVSGKRTPSPPAKPYPAATRNAPRPSRKIALPNKVS